MIKILDTELDLGLDFLEQIEFCPNSHNCLWLKRSSLFRVPDALPKNCLRQNCKVMVFRRILENDSPAFYAETLRLSQFAKIEKESTLAVIKRKGNRGQRLQKRLVRHAYDLHAFGQLVAIAIYPLFLKVNEIPLLNAQEIAELKDSFREQEIRQTIEKMSEINRDWLAWISSVMENLSSQKTYSAALIYLVYLFLKGLEKIQLPDFENMSQEEKEKFFSEIENYLKGPR